MEDRVVEKAKKHFHLRKVSVNPDLPIFKVRDDFLSKLETN